MKSLLEIELRQILKDTNGFQMAQPRQHRCTPRRRYSLNSNLNINSPIYFFGLSSESKDSFDIAKYFFCDCTSVSICRWLFECVRSLAASYFLSKELSLCLKLWFSNPYIFATQCHRPKIFHTLDSVRFFLCLLSL